MLIHKVDRNPQGPKPTTLFPYLPQGSTGSRTWSPQPRPARVASGKAHSGQAGRRVCVWWGWGEWTTISQEAHYSRIFNLGGTGSNIGMQNEAAWGPAPPQA